MEDDASQLKKQVEQLQCSVSGLIAKNQEQQGKIQKLEKAIRYKRAT